MLKKTISNLYLSNPINQNQIIGLEVDSDCFTLDIKCGLNLVFQDVYDQICGIKNPDVTLGCIEGTTLNEIIESIDSKLCPDPVTPTEQVDITGLNNCEYGNWDCSNTDLCFPSYNTIEELLQNLITRNLDLSKQVKENCDTISSLEMRLNQLELQINNLQCC